MAGGKRATEVARAIHHSLKATENYLEKFKRVAYLRKRKGFTEFEISRTVGISTVATKTFVSIYDEFKGKALFDHRMEEINIAGNVYNLAEGEKKRLTFVEELYARQARQTMNHNISANFASYEPVHYKTFSGALEAFFKQECTQIGGFRTRQTLVNVIYGMVLKFFPETEHLRQEQTVWTTVHKDAKGAYGKSIKDTELTPVVLTLVQDTDAIDRAHGKKLREIKKEATARLCQEAYSQNGCLTESELSVMLKMSPHTVGLYLREYETEHKTVLPRRGTIHDMGPTLTHKKIIIEKLFIEQKTVQQVIRETCHSARAIERYITSFKQILLCYRIRNEHQ